METPDHLLSWVDPCWSEPYLVPSVVSHDSASKACKRKLAEAYALNQKLNGQLGWQVGETLLVEDTLKKKRVDRGRILALVPYYQERAKEQRKDHYSTRSKKLMQLRTDQVIKPLDKGKATWCRKYKAKPRTNDWYNAKLVIDNKRDLIGNVESDDESSSLVSDYSFNMESLYKSHKFKWECSKRYSGVGQPLKWPIKETKWHSVGVDVFGSSRGLITLWNDDLFKWDFIISAQAVLLSSWCIGGDFNTILDHLERKGGECSKASMKGFNEFILKAMVIDLPMQAKLRADKFILKKWAKQKKRETENLKCLEVSVADVEPKASTVGWLPKLREERSKLISQL
ncbi:hypothetical protein Dsin_013534 [Dipteronia sinensis]|uniref:Uncharacterized protein n=1 Tax=Dipteronia sinensis TaxID=43782 RepID=A0AAE0E971_9ROSI|nr:hypothetical protein Dsin_013534 [Dipteronia sinensis]